MGDRESGGRAGALWEAGGAEQTQAGKHEERDAARNK